MFFNQLTIKEINSNGALRLAVSESISNSTLYSANSKPDTSSCIKSLSPQVSSKLASS